MCNNDENWGKIMLKGVTEHNSLNYYETSTNI